MVARMVATHSETVHARPHISKLLANNDYGLKYWNVSVVGKLSLRTVYCEGEKKLSER